MFGHKKSLKIWELNFDLVKLRLASPKAYSAPAAGSYERSKKRQKNAIAMVFDKTLFQ